MRKYFASLLLLVLTGFVLLVGCGGGSSEPPPGAAGQERSGKARFTIQWPSPSTRLVPAAAQSIQIALTRDGQTLDQQVVARPPIGQNTSLVTFNNLTPGDVLATAAAYPNSDATGTPQATGAISLNIVPDDTTFALLTLNSTISTVTVSPAPPSVVQGGTLSLTATALDASGALVLTDPANWLWSSNDPKVATVVPSGNPTTLSGLAAGTVTITVTERESGRSGNTAATVADPVSVAISPTTVTVPRDTRQPFTATVLGTTNTAVTWSIQEGDTGGAIDASGNYQAPDTAGVYHVVATSVADPTKSAVATVNVPVEVSIRPQFVTMQPSIPNQFDSTQQFTADIGGTANTAVFWSVQEGAAGGTIDSTGRYVAPQALGTYHVIATSQADPTQSATATVVVTDTPASPVP